MQHVICHVVQRDSSAISLTEFSFILSAKPLTDEGGEETGVPREDMRRQASENATYLSPKI